MKYFVVCCSLLLGLITGCGGGGGESTPTGGNGGGSGGGDIIYTRFPIAFPYSTTTPHTLSQPSLPLVSKNLVQLNDALAVLAFTGEMTSLQTYTMNLQRIAANTPCTTGSVLIKDSRDVVSSEFKACAIAGVEIDGQVFINKIAEPVPEITYKVTIAHPETRQQYSLVGYMFLTSQTEIKATGTISSPNMPTLRYENLYLDLFGTGERLLPRLLSGQITFADQGTVTIKATIPTTASVPNFLNQVTISPLYDLDLGDEGILQQWFRDGSIRVTQGSALVHAYPASLIYQTPTSNQTPIPKLEVISEVLAANQPFQLTHFSSIDADGDALTFDLQVESLMPDAVMTVTPNATGYRLLASMSGEYLAKLTVTDLKGAKASVEKLLRVSYSAQNPNSMIEQTLQLTNLKPFEHPLRVAKGKQAQIVFGPAGMTIQNNILRWTPQIPAVGGTTLIEASFNVPGDTFSESTTLYVDTPVASQQSFINRDWGYSAQLQPLIGGRSNEYLYVAGGQPAAVLKLQDQQIQVQGLPVAVPDVVRQSNWLRKKADGFELLTLDGNSRWVNMQTGMESNLPINIKAMMSMTFDYEQDGQYDALVSTDGLNLKVLNNSGTILWDNEKGNILNIVKSVVGHCDADQDGFEDVVIQNIPGTNELVSLKKRQILGSVEDDVFVIKSPSKRCYLLRVKDNQLQGLYSFNNNQINFNAYTGPITRVSKPIVQGRFITDFDIGVMATLDRTAAIIAIKDNQLSVVQAPRANSKILGAADMDQDGREELIAFDGASLQGFHFENGFWKRIYQPAFQANSVPTYQTADGQLWMSDSDIRYQQQWYGAKDPKLPSEIRFLHNLVHRDITKMPDGELRFDDADGNMLWLSKPTFSQPDMRTFSTIKTSEITVALAANGEAAVLDTRTGVQKYRITGGQEYWNSAKLYRLQPGLHLLWSYTHPEVMLMTDNGYSWLNVPELASSFRWQPILAKIDNGYLAGTRLLLGDERPADAFEIAFPIDVAAMCDPLRFNCNGHIVDGVEQGTNNLLWGQLPDIWPTGSVVGVRQLDGSYAAFVVGSPVLNIFEPAKP